MASFITRVLKTLATLVTAYFLLFLLVLFLLVGLGTFFQPQAVSVADKTILVMDLGFELTDKPKSEDPARMMVEAVQGTMLENASLREVLDGLEEARTDSRIQALLLTGNLYPGGSYAALREVRQAIRRFAQDKPVHAFIDGDALRDVYLKSAATELHASPYGSVDFRGLRAERMYLGEAFERIGIEVQVEAFESYKTAAEAYTQGSMSDEERQQLEALLKDLWAVILGDMAVDREVDPDFLDLQAETRLMIFGEAVVAAGLADQLTSMDELIDQLTELGAYDAELESFRQVDFLDYLDLNRPVLPELELPGAPNKVALVYAEGILMEGDGGGMEGTIGGDELVRELRRLRRDDTVKAVVLRINSPGGSATASFKVTRELELTNAVKPVVASMGGIAASAGYMIAAPAEQIYCEPSTITGSIGVVLMLSNMEGLAEKLSLQFEGVETHPFAGTFSLARAKTPEEMAQIRAMGASFYDEFLDIVAKNRDMEPAAVRDRAQGRVWSGLAARELGLVDEIGGLSTAIQRAADLAGIGDDFRLIEWPRRLSLEEQIETLLLGVSAVRPPVLHDGTLLQAWQDLADEVRRLNFLNDPHGQYAILPYSLKIR